MNLAVVYWSGTGNTETMANAIVDGIKEAGGQVTAFQASEFNSSLVDDFDAFAFGCPSMGNEILEEDEFQPMWDDVKPKLSSKKVVLFGSYGWGDGEWMRNWQEDCKDEGISLLTEGLIVNEEPDEEDLTDCRNLGKTLVNPNN